MLSKSLYFRSILFKRTDNFCSVLPDLSGCRIYETKFSTLASFLFFPHFLFLVSLLLFFWPSKTFNFFVTVAMLPRYQSAVNCNSIKVEGNFMQNLNYRYYCYFSSIEFEYLLGRVEGLPSQGRGDGRNLKIVYFLESDFGNDDGQCRYIRGRCP